MHRVLVLGATSDGTLPACSYEWKPAAGFISVHPVLGHALAAGLGRQ